MKAIRSTSFWAFSAAAALAALAGSASAQLVVGNTSGSAQQISLIDLSGQTPPRVLVDNSVCASGNCQQAIGIAADNANGILYWITPANQLYKATFSTSGYLTPVLIGTVSGGASGLAWDSVDNQLLGRAVVSSVSTLVAINTTTAATTPLCTISGASAAGARVAGLDFDPLTNSVVYSTSTSLDFPAQQELGLFRISKPWSSPDVTKLAKYPAECYFGFEGVAVGNGRVYLDGASGGLPALGPRDRVYNLATGTYENLDTILISAIGGSTWAPSLLVPPAGTNLVVSTGASESHSVSAGGLITFSVRIDNYGAAPSGPVTLTVTMPPTSDATFASSTPAPDSATPAQLTYSLPPIPGYGANAYMNVKIQLNAVAPDATVNLSATATTTSDIDLGNNFASASTHVKPVQPATAPIKALLSTKSSLANSLVPDGIGDRFTDFEGAHASLDGSYWAISGTTNYLFISGTPLKDRVLVRAATGGSPQVILRRAHTSVAGAELRFHNEVFDVSNSGLIGISATTRTAAGQPQRNNVLTTFDGMTFNIIAKQTNPIPGLPGATYGSSMGGVHFLANGDVVFGATSSAGVPIFFGPSGNSVRVQQGVTIPTGASGVIGYMEIDDLGYVNTWYSADGTHSIYRAAISTEPSATEGVLVVDGSVVLQEGVTMIAPGVQTNFVVNDQSGPSMGATGMWFYPDRSYSRPDHLLRGFGTSILQTYRTGDPIFIGATETWADTAGTNTIFGLTTAFDPRDTFFTYDSDASGHYVIGGYTNSSDPFTDSVLVYDNRVVIARENDPVDLDGNGIFDDGMYIRAFVRTDAVGGFYGPIAFTNDHAILVCVSLRDEAAALGHLNDTPLERALVRIPLPGCSVADIARLGGTGGADGQLTVDDLVYFLAQFFSGNVAVADIAVLGGAPGHDGQITVDDLVYYLSQFFAGCP